MEKLETTMVDAKHQLSIERVKVSYCEEEMDHVRKDNRRLLRESEFLKSDLSLAEKDLKASKEYCASLQRDLREVGTKLNQKTNTLFLMADEEALLKNEIAALNQVPFLVQSEIRPQIYRRQQNLFLRNIPMLFATNLPIF